jgi:Holliday junction DNA helicase RuvA
MIGSLRGRLTDKHPPHITLECSGVGYEIETPMSTFFDLPDVGTDLFLYTHLQVREDAQTLYGFSTEHEKVLFRMLLKVNGVGAKMALAILSGMGVADFQRCVQFEDTATLTKIPGVGKKTADRLILDLRDKFGKDNVTAFPKGAVSRADAKTEAVDALVALGYKQAEMSRLVGNLDTEDKSAEDIIRLALRQAVS